MVLTKRMQEIERDGEWLKNRKSKGNYIDSTTLTVDEIAEELADIPKKLGGTAAKRRLTLAKELRRRQKMIDDRKKLRDRNKLAGKYKSSLTTEEKVIAVTMLEMGNSQKEVAEHLNRTIACISAFSIKFRDTPDCLVRELADSFEYIEQIKLTGLSNKALGVLGKFLTDQNENGVSKPGAVISLLDKSFQMRRLLGNKSTANIAQITKVNEIADEVKQEMAKIAELEQKLSNI